MVLGGDQRSTAAFVARLIAAPVLLVPGWPINRSELEATHLCPGVTPWTGIASAGAAGGLATHAASKAVPRLKALRIDRLFRHDSVHLEPAVLDPERESSFDQVEGVLAELLIAPARQDFE